MTAQNENNLLIDCTAANNRISGIERYVRELAPLVADLIVKQGGRVTVVLSEGTSWWPINLSQSRDVDVVFLTARNRIVKDQIQLPMLARARQINAAWFPALPPSPLFFLLNRNCFVVRTIHDAVMWNHAQTMSKGNRFYYRPMENFGLPRYDAVHTVSGFSKNELAHLFPSIENRITASGNGVSNIADVNKQDFAPVTAPWFGRIGDRKVLLFVGTTEPRKNLPFLLHVFRKVLARHPDVRFVIAGRAGWGDAEVQLTIDALNLRESVVLTGAVDDASLNWLYKHAEFLLIPSLSEGFGLPVAEAMSVGLPVISSNAGALPEVAGDAAMLLSPEDEEGWLNAVCSLLDKPEMKISMVSRGYKQAARFSWLAVAERIAATFNGRLGTARGEN